MVLSFKKIAKYYYKATIIKYSQLCIMLVNLQLSACLSCFYLLMYKLHKVMLCIM